MAGLFPAIGEWIIPQTEVQGFLLEGVALIGVMLPYSPLHHLLFLETDRPLVMTSGNLSEEPIAKDNDDAVEKLNNPTAETALEAIRILVSGLKCLDEAHIYLTGHGAESTGQLWFRNGWGGITPGPNMLSLSSPDTASAWSRTCSAESRTRGPRASRRLRGSRSSRSGVTRDDCR